MSKSLLVGLTLLLLASGCGDEPASRPPLSRNELKFTADSICQEVTADLVQIAQSPVGLTGRPSGVLATTQGGLHKLESLRPPDRLAKQFRQFVREVRNREKQREMIFANLPHAPRGLGPPVGRFNHFTAKANAAAAKLKLAQCPGF
jgi:hypothetical protein